MIFAAFLGPYIAAGAAYPLLLLAGRTPYLWVASITTCLLIVCFPWLVPSDEPLLRFLASMSAAILAIKVIDVSIDIRHRRVPTGPEYLAFLANPFTHVRRCLMHECRPLRGENLSAVVAGSVTCAIAIALLLALFHADWTGLPFLAEHVSKVLVLMLAITSGLTGAAALWRLGGGTARDFMDRPFTARTPAEFWRRYNRNVHQFFWQDVFGGKQYRRAPIRTILLVFVLSALLHEWIFMAAVGRVQGYQTAFFILQGLAAIATARVKVRGWQVVPWTAGTLLFNLLTSVLFFASIHEVAPFYSQALPAWLRGW